jgi:hypothetical protein
LLGINTMHPRLTWLEKLLKKNAPFYGQIENTLYAMKINPPENNPYANIASFRFFCLFTTVGVGDYGKNKIRDIHIRFQFEKDVASVPDMEIVSIRPTGESREVGTTRHKKKQTSDEITTYQYPVYINISSSTGVGNYAMWDFKQGGAAAWTGQYDLQIIFKINESIEHIKPGRGSYHVNWKVNINDRPLMDHEGNMPQPRPVDLLI